MAWYRIFARQATGANVKVRLNDYFLPGSGQTVSEACHWIYLTLRSVCISEHFAILCMYYRAVLCVGLRLHEGFRFRGGVSLGVGLRLRLAVGPTEGWVGVSNGLRL